MYSILINTCDKFEDCWNPFFKLWSIYWPDCKGKIYLNTEFKDYHYDSLDITAVKSCEGKSFKGKFATWSQCLKWALDKIEDDIVLYMQEDYFLTDSVNNETVEQYVEWLSQHETISCIHLTNQGIPGQNPFGELNLQIGQKSHFSYLSCQAAIWRKKDLLALIRDYETAWNFEWWGSKRAKYSKMTFLTIDHQYIEQGGQIIPYIFTGIIGGRWNPPVVEHFKNHNILVDFTRRGFYDKEKTQSIKQRLKAKWNSYRPWRSILEIIRMKIKSLYD